MVDPIVKWVPPSNGRNEEEIKWRGFIYVLEFQMIFSSHACMSKNYEHDSNHL